jgi:hypothetical protein
MLPLQWGVESPPMNKKGLKYGKEHMIMASLNDEI